MIHYNGNVHHPPPTLEHVNERVHTYFPVVASYNFLGTGALEDLRGSGRCPSGKFTVVSGA